MKYRLSPRVALLIIAALFFLPLVLAWLMYSGTIEFRPHSTRNFGQLVHPPMPLTWAGVHPDRSTDGPLAGTFEGHWLILHAVPQPCGEDCLRDIADLRQVHRAAGRQQSRIRLALLHDTEGYKLAEIEALTGIPVGTVKSRLHRARARLREILVADGTIS